MRLITEILEHEPVSMPDKINYQFCPECGDIMKECDRVSEKDSTYKWYECGKNECNGCWLEKLQ